MCCDIWPAFLLFSFPRHRRRPRSGPPSRSRSTWAFRPARGSTWWPACHPGAVRSQKSLGQRLVIIDYKAGAAGNIASELRGPRQAPDGYTLVLLGTAATHGEQCRAVQEAALRRGNRLHAGGAGARRVERADDQPRGDRCQARSRSLSTKVKAATPAKYNYASTGNGAGTHHGLCRIQFARPGARRWCTCPTRAGPRRSRAC